MSTLLEPLFIIVFFVFIRAGDIALSAAKARDIIRAIVYLIAAIFALIYIVYTPAH